MNPIDYGTYTPCAMGSVDLSRKLYLTELASRVIARGWHPPSGAILPDGVVASFGPSLTRFCDPSDADAAAADRAIGSCTFLLANHGDLHIEWEEKDHDEIAKLIRAKMKAGVTFHILDPASFELVPIRRTHLTMGREVFVRDADIKKFIESGFARFATTSFETVGQIKTLGIARSAEEAARTDTVAIQPAISASSRTETDNLIGAAAIAEFLDRDLGIKPTLGTTFTERTVYNWVNRRKLPVGRPPESTTLVASKVVLRQWFDDIARSIDPRIRLRADTAEHAS
jgi:hypothetical protein